jgi:hypothetical protein
MIKINDILGLLNDSLAAHSFKDIVFHKIARLVEKDEVLAPRKYTGSGELTDIIEDAKGLIVYHRILNVDNNDDLEGGFGRNSLTTETYTILTVFYGNQIAINDDCEDHNYTLANEFKKLIPRRYPLTDINSVKIIDINYDKNALSDQEGIAIIPENILFSIESEIEVKKIEKCEILCAPTNLTAIVTTDSQIDLSWEDNTTTEVGFEVWRSTDLVNYRLIVKLDANTTTYNDTGLTEGTIYHYKVRAFDNSSGGEWSNIVSKMALSGIVYQRPMLSQQSVSYRTFDDGWHLANGTYSYTPPVYPVSCAELDDTILTDAGFYTLKSNNAFGNKDRFTDDLGGQDFIGRGYGIDHLTGLGYAYAVLDGIDWNTAIDTAAASTALGYSDWRITSYREATILYSASLRFYGGFLMTEAYTTAWTAITSTSRFGLETTWSLSCQYVAGASVYLKTNIPDKNGAGTLAAGYIIVRNHYT